MIDLVQWCILSCQLSKMARRENDAFLRADLSLGTSVRPVFTFCENTAPRQALAKVRSFARGEKRSAGGCLR